MTAFRMASPQHEHPRPGSNRQLILAAQIAFLPTGILTTLLGPMLPILIARWALNDTQAGNLFLVQFLASLAGVQISGILLARVGFRPAFLSGLLLMAGGVATLYLGSPGLGLVSVAVCGLGLGFIIPHRQFDDRRNHSRFAGGGRKPVEFLLGSRRRALLVAGRVGAAAPVDTRFSWSCVGTPGAAGSKRAQPAVSRCGQIHRLRDCLAENLQGSHPLAVRRGVLSLPRG